MRLPVGESGVAVGHEESARSRGHILGEVAGEQPTVVEIDFDILGAHENPQAHPLADRETYLVERAAVRQRMPH